MDNRKAVTAFLTYKAASEGAQRGDGQTDGRSDAWAFYKMTFQVLNETFGFASTAPEEVGEGGLS